MLELIRELIEGGHAYPAADGSGDVYFDVRSYADYGALSGQRVDAMEPAADAPERGKRDPRDFALWKGAKADEPPEATWPSPWGPGRPGWHIECSAMCWRYLGEEFDIHGGGLDLIFPHHENEVAQSHAAGFGFARYWVHHALLNLGDAKMSKSLGNVIDLAGVVAQGVRPVELRYYLAAPHYRSRIDYSYEALAEAGAAYRRIEGFVQRAVERVGAVEPRADSRSCTRRSATATPRSPLATTGPPARRSETSARCSTSSASTHSIRSGQTRPAPASSRSSTPSCGSHWNSAPPPVPAKTGPPPTPCAISSAGPASRSRTRRTVHGGRSRARAAADAGQLRAPQPAHQRQEGRHDWVRRQEPAVSSR
jgi:hypothetical protein